MLKAKVPEVKEKRLKMFVFGPAGVGKTTAAIQFPKSYIIDTERGTDFYADTIKKAGSVVLQTLNIDEVKEELKALATEKHAYKTLIIDPVTQIYNNCQEKWTRTFEQYAKSEKEKDTQDFGMRFWGKVKGDFKGLQRLMLALDMNCVILSHQKDVYGTSFSKIGVTFDSMKGDDYLFDLVFRVERKNGDLMAYKVKERAEIGKERFPAEFIWSYENFCKFYGKEIIEKDSTPVVMATAEQVTKITRLVEIVKIEDEVLNKWFAKADVDSFAEMTGEQIQKCIEYVEKKINGLPNGNGNGVVEPPKKKGK